MNFERRKTNGLLDRRNQFEYKISNEFYNGWFTINEMSRFKECTISKGCIQNRLKENKRNNKFDTMYSLVITERRNTWSKNQKGFNLSKECLDFIKIMKLFKPGSLANKVR